MQISITGYVFLSFFPLARLYHRFHPPDNVVGDTDKNIQWDQEVLTETLAQCGLGKGPQDQLQNCAPLNKSLSQQNMLDCRYENKIVDECVSFVLSLVTS